MQELQYEYFFDSLKARSEDEFVSNLDALNEELDWLDYSEEAGMAWTAINTFRVNSSSCWTNLQRQAIGTIISIKKSLQR